MGKLKKIWEWVSHGDTVWGIMNILFPTLVGSGGGLFAQFSSLSPVFIFFSIVVGIAIGLFISNEIVARRLREKLNLPLKERPEKTPNWLEQELSFDLKRVREGMQGKTTRWDFSGIYNRESYFDVFVELTNTTVFTFCLKSISGFMKIAGEPCMNPLQVSTRFGIKRDKPIDIHVRQHIAPETVTIIQDAGNNNQKIEFNLGEAIFEIENTTEGYEKYIPYLTGGIYNIVPKDGLKGI